MKTKFSLVTLLIVAALLLATGAAYARAAAGYTLDWWTVDGGGGRASAAAYTLYGAAGQPDSASLSGGSFTLWGGFWGGAPANRNIFIPLVRR